MDIFIICFSVLVAVCFASFFSVVVTRGLRNSLLGGSKCDHCQKEIPWILKFPVISILYLLLLNKGRSACCNKVLSTKYILSELFSLLIGVFAGIVILRLPDISTIILFSVLTLIFLFMAIDDIWNLEIEVVLVFVMGLFVFIAALILPNSTQSLFLGRVLTQSNLLIAILLAVVVVLLIILSRGKGLGVGDVFIVFFMGFSLGTRGSLIALQLAIYLAAICGVTYSAIQGKFKGTIVPLVPFLLLGWILYLAFPQAFLFLWPQISYI